jgi:hypothetical protein
VVLVGVVGVAENGAEGVVEVEVENVVEVEVEVEGVDEVEGCGEEFPMKNAAIMLERANFPAEPFGIEHAQGALEAADHISNSLGLSDDECLLAKSSAMFHDLGRTQPWWCEDNGARLRSAELAAHVFNDDPEWFARPDLIFRACKMIYRLDLSGTAPDDPLGQTLWDAELLETSRFDPGGLKGARVVRDAYAKLVTPWARNEKNQRCWVERYLKAQSAQRGVAGTGSQAFGSADELLRGMRR